MAAALLLLAVVVGCMEAPPAGRLEGRQLQWSRAALQFGEGHDHANATQHAGLSTPNFRVVGHDPLNSTYYGAPAGGYLCGDQQRMPDGRRIAAVESRSEVGFAVVDLTDPARPRWLGELVMRSTNVYDLAVVPDGKHLALVTERIDLDRILIPPANDPGFTTFAASTPSASSPASATPAASVASLLPDPMLPGLLWRSACHPEGRPVAWRAPLPGGSTQTAGSGEDPVPRPVSLLLVDFTLPEAPAIVDQVPLYGEGHSVFATREAGRTLLLVTTHGLTPPDHLPGPSPVPIPVPGTHGLVTGHFTAYGFYEVTPTPAGDRVALLSLYKPPAADGTPLGPRGHDAWMAVHPVTGTLVGYLVGGDRFTIVDLTDLRNPREVGRWSDMAPGREGYAGSLHSVLPLDALRNGRHFTIVGPEFHGHPDNQPSGTVWVLDTTDPAAPRVVAGWTLPHEVEWSGEYMFSNHYLNVQGDTLLVSMYHGGVWAIGLEGAWTREPGDPLLLLPSVGVFLPSAPAMDPAVKVRWTPTVEEVLVLDDETLATFDGWTGVWTFTFDEGMPMAPPEPWPLIAP